MPKSNQEYWFVKLGKNKIRDTLHLSKLHEMDWQKLVVWECELKETDILLEKMKTFLKE
jgi:DNA mismatch endonuclease (patch repair protein)